MRSGLGSKPFSKIHIEISNICNLQCSFCPEVIRAKKLIELDLFEKIVAQAAPLTEQICFHLMGDPLVHHKLPELVEITHRHSAKINLVTNGLLLREEKAELLLHPAFRQVNFSLHSFPDNFPEKDPNSYLEKIFRYTERAFELRPDLYINFRLWNLQDVKGGGHSNLEMLKKIEERFDFKLPAEIDVRRGKSVRIKNRLYLHFDTEFIWPSLDLPVLGSRGSCYGLKSHFGVLVDGTVVPCCLDKEGLIPLGNVRERSLDEILRSPRAIALLKGFEQKKLTEELCRRCNYIERFGRPQENFKQT